MRDITRRSLNIGFNAVFRDRLNVNLRMSYIGYRKTGRGTTVASNPFTEIDAYTVVNAAMTYRGTGSFFQRLKLQLAVQNLLDKETIIPESDKPGPSSPPAFPSPAGPYSSALPSPISHRPTRRHFSQAARGEHRAAEQVPESAIKEFHSFSTSLLPPAVVRLQEPDLRRHHRPTGTNHTPRDWRISEPKRSLFKVVPWSAMIS